MHRNFSIAFPFSDTQVGGSYVSASLLARDIKNAGHRPIILLPAQGPNSELFYRWNMIPIYYNLPLNHVEKLRDTRGILSKILASKASITTYQIALKTFKKIKPDIVHINDDGTMLTWGLAAKQLGIPVIWHIRQQKGNWWLDRIRLHLADHIIYVAAAIKSRFSVHKRLPPGTVIYNSVDTDIFRPPSDKKIAKERMGLNPTSITIGFVGNLVSRKRPEWVATAGAELIQKGLDIEIVFVGSDISKGKYQQKLQEIAKSSGESDRFIFLDYRKDMPQVMQALDILVLPSEPMGEAFPRVILEAMASSVAVVATNVAGIPEIIQHGICGMLVSPESQANMLEAIENLTRNSSMIVDFGSQGRRIVEENFSTRASIPKIGEIYGTLSE